MIQRPALSVGKRDAVCVGGVAVLTDDVEYALDKSPYLHGNSADTACAYGQKQLKQTALVEAEVEVVYAEGAEEYSQQAGGNFGLSVGSGRRGLCRLLSRLSRLTGSLGGASAPAGVPQEGQNPAPSGISVPQFLQNMIISSL